MANSFSGITDMQLLSHLIGPRRSRRLYRGSLTPLFAADAESPLFICAVARELVKRWLTEDIQRGGTHANPAAVREFLRLHFAGREYESFVALFLDAQNRLIVSEELFRGTLTQTSVYPREVVKAALRTNAAGVIFAHNHPSGVAEPSLQDQSLTRTLTEALALVDVKALDHFIVAGNRVLSFAERGLM